MKTKAIVVALGVALTATPVLAQSFDQLSQDLADQTAAGGSRLDDAQWQFRDGNVREGCDFLEQARQHYDQAWHDTQAMVDMVNGSDDSQDDKDKAMEMLNENQQQLSSIADQMSDIYHSNCVQ